MAYRYGNRYQMTLLPKRMEDYVDADAPVREYDAFVEAIDLENPGIQSGLRKVGNSKHDPKAILKLYVMDIPTGGRVRGNWSVHRIIIYHLNPATRLCLVAGLGQKW
ncbi:MAG: hypothetical protein HRF42_06885 [Candidatus Brocadia sp.]